MPMDEHKYAARRQHMVATQLRDRGITDERVLAQMARVPRHCFVPPALAEQSYDDNPLPIGDEQTISQPYMVAYMTSLLELGHKDRVLEIGTGSGYHAAILAGLCKKVITVERKSRLRERAQVCLNRLQIGNVQVREGDGSLGHLECAPYDAIMVAAASPKIPRELMRQLADGGRLVCPVGSRTRQTLFRVVRQGEKFTHTEHTDCIFVPLVGKDGWPTAR